LLSDFMVVPNLSIQERIHFRNVLREARYGALADAEGFLQMCFAIEALGKRLKPNARSLADCRGLLKGFVAEAGLLSDDTATTGAEKRFDALFEALREARNDIAHTGAYARHIAVEAVSLSLVLEDALMNMRMTVEDFMVTTPVTIEPWQSVGYARQLMLMNSFSYLPMWDGNEWHLLTDIAVAKYLRPDWPASLKKSKSVADAKEDGLQLTKVSPVNAQEVVTALLGQSEMPGLWLVTQEGYPPGHLVGVLSPFELM
jgi:hypothetical protein